MSVIRKNMAYRKKVNHVILMNGLFKFFIHLKLELLTQFPASNDEKCDYNNIIELFY